MKNITQLGQLVPATEKSLQAMQSDRDWFARNPRRTYRIRREIPGEVPGEAPHRCDTTKWTIWTLLKQLEPGARLKVRFCVLRGAEPVDSDRTLRPLFDYLVEHPPADYYPALWNKNSAGGKHIMRAFRPPVRVGASHLVFGPECEGGVQ